MSPIRKGLYRSQDGLILGVCQGIADWRQMPVFWVRVIAILLIIVSHGIPGIIVYFILGMILQPSPYKGKPKNVDTMKRAERVERKPKKRSTP